MLVLIADKLPAQGLAALRELGLTVDDRPELSADDLAALDAAVPVGAVAGDRYGDMSHIDA